MDSIILFIIDSFSIVYNLLSQIEMFGISLLEFLLALFVIGVMIPILLSLAKNGLGSSSRAYKNEVRKSKGN